VTSATYRQSSRVSAAQLERNPRNVWLAAVRDSARCRSGPGSRAQRVGSDHDKLGGPSVIPPVPQNVLDYNYTYPSYWKPAEGPSGIAEPCTVSASGRCPIR